jgi:predicted lipoprotein
MGEALADGRPDGQANGRKWITPPLWGVGLIHDVNGHNRLLHDGRARRAGEVRGVIVMNAIPVGRRAEKRSAFRRMHRAWSAPRAADFVLASTQLTPAIESLCVATAAEPALQDARQNWLYSLFAWERLSAVAIGPVLERRSQRQIDFTPTRPHLVEKAVKNAPTSAAEMELIGTPAKGLPSLEWLLWVKPIQPASAEFRYAAQLAAEIGREADALAAAHMAPTEAQAALSELVNQWIGAWNGCTGATWKCRRA